MTVANNGKEAVQHWQSDHFDAILMDVDMPVMNGYEATERIRELEQGDAHIPVVAMTAHAMQGAREECLRHGMDGYLTKPIDTEVLWRELDKLQGHDWRDEGEENTVFTEQALPVVDFAKARVTMDDNQELFEEIVRLFLVDAPLHLQKIQVGEQQRDATTIRHSAHTLRGMVGIFAAERTLQAAADVEQHATDADVAAKVEVLANALAELEAAIRAYRW